MIAGYYGFGNAGDDLILYSLIQQLRQDDPHVSITVLSQSPSETEHLFGVSAVNRWRPWAWAVPLLRARRFILGGGGLLQESTGPWNHFYYLSLVAAAALFGCTTEVVALGVDPIRSPFNRFWTRLILNHWAGELSVRDEASRQALKEAGVSVPILIRRDPVFSLHQEKSVPGSAAIAFALSPSKARPHWSDEVAFLCDRLAGELHVAIDLLVFFPQDDAKLAESIARASKAVRQVRLYKNPIDILFWMPHYQLVVASRFHALVLAAGCGVSCMGWGAQKKVQTLCGERSMPYINTEIAWTPEEQFQRLSALYQWRNKSVILEREQVDFAR